MNQQVPNLDNGGVDFVPGRYLFRTLLRYRFKIQIADHIKLNVKLLELINKNLY